MNRDSQNTEFQSVKRSLHGRQAEDNGRTEYFVALHEKSSASGFLATSYFFEALDFYTRDNDQVGAARSQIMIAEVFVLLSEQKGTLTFSDIAGGYALDALAALQEPSTAPIEWGHGMLLLGITDYLRGAQGTSGSIPRLRESHRSLTEALKIFSDVGDEHLEKRAIRCLVLVEQAIEKLL